MTTALESVLAAAHPGISVVVSDNSTDPAEVERVREFCGGLPAGVVEYVRPPEPLPMAEHWEWLRHQITERVAPTHVGYLTDRFVFVEGALAQLMETLAREPDTVLSYHHDPVKDLSTPVELVQSQWTGDLFELDNSALIAMSSRGHYGDHLPRMLNSIAPVAVLDEIERRFGDVFGAVAPDYRFAYRSLAVRDTTLLLDRACTLHHGMRASAGIGYLRGEKTEASHDFARQLSVPQYGDTPEPEFDTIANAIFQEYCAVRAELGDGRFPPLDRDGYLAANAVSVDRMERTEARARMEALLERHGWTRRHAARHAARLTAEVSGYFLRHPSALGRSLKRQLWDRPPGTPAARLLPRVGLNPRVKEDLMFGSNVEAIAHANAHPRPRTRQAWHVYRLARAGAIRARRPAPKPGSGA